MMVRKRGKIVTWKDDKGFGFIEPLTGGKQVFVHISALPDDARRPALGTEVSYSESSDGQGRVRAEDVKLAGAGLSFGPAAKAFVVASAFLLAVTGIVNIGILPAMVLWFYLGMSGVTFVVYAMDKSSAQKGGQRTPEDTLHMLALAGGWPGALYAQQLLRHKSSKASFRAVFWVTLVLNVSALGYVLSDYGTWIVEILRRMDG